GARFATSGRPGALTAWDGRRRLGTVARSSDAVSLLSRAAWVPAGSTSPLSGSNRSSPHAIDEARPWWVVASLGAAVALVGGVIVAREVAEDRQRLHIEF